MYSKCSRYRYRYCVFGGGDLGRESYRYRPLLYDILHDITLEYIFDSIRIPLVHVAFFGKVLQITFGIPLFRGPFPLRWTHLLKVEISFGKLHYENHPIWGAIREKRLIFFRSRACQTPLFGLPAPSVGSNETVFWKKCSMLPIFFKIKK